MGTRKSAQRREQDKKRKRVARTADIAQQRLRTVFVIMPFTSTPTRSEEDLTEFFKSNLKVPIETATDILSDTYSVRRSDDTFNITEQIVHDLYAADIVVCDLSGHHANPNVMYELGVRLALTNKPVILIREESPDNRRIFDIQGFYAHEYSPKRYRHLEEHIIAKLRKFESGEEVYESPVLKILHQSPSLLRRLRLERVVGILRMMGDGLIGTKAAASRVIDAFLEREAGIQVGAMLTENVLFGEATQIAKLDWSTIRLQPKVPPAFQTFLSEPMLTGFLPATQETRVVNVISRFYNACFAVDLVWHKPTLTDVLQFYGETFRISRLAHSLADYLAADSDVARAEAWELVDFLVEVSVADLSEILASRGDDESPTA